MMQGWAKLYNKLATFGAARGGNVAITFAFATLPLIAAVGSAVDYTRANAVKASLQTALDSTALLLSKEARTDTADQLQANATKYFKAAFAPPDAQNILVSATTSGTSLVINASAAVPTTLMGVFGFKSMTVGASSTAKWGLRRLRVALVLDNSGSMLVGDSSGNIKIEALRTATKNLLTQLQNASSIQGDVYVSIVPFDNRVNFGASNLNSDWIDWTAWDQDWFDTHGTCSDSGDSPSRSVCQAAHCSKTKFTTQTKCTNHNETWLPPGTWTPTTTPPDHTQWNGCILDRGPSDKSLLTTTGQDDDQIVDSPTSDNATKAPAVPLSGVIGDDQSLDTIPCNASSIMGLTNDWNALQSMMDNMSPIPFASTNQPIGLVWGWQTLVGGGPFTAPPLDPNYQYEQAIIVLSDGLNTFDRWFGNKNVDIAPDVDLRMYNADGNGTCKNVKNTGVTIYSIQVNTSGDPLSQVMQNCASLGNFFMITKADQLDTLFHQIGDKLTNLRVAQ